LTSNFKIAYDADRRVDTPVAVTILARTGSLTVGKVDIYTPYVETE
jgi:hypothetical protein